MLIEISFILLQNYSTGSRSPFLIFLVQKKNEIFSFFWEEKQDCELYYAIVTNIPFYFQI